MARIHITIDIPHSGPAQVSITTDDNASRPVSPRDLATAPGSDASQAADGRALRATREARGWSQTELAKRIGCSPATISQLEVSGRRLSERLMVKIKAAGLVLASDPAPNRNGR